MDKGILLVESHPSSPDVEDEYNTWYNDVHVIDVLALDGFVGARRLAPVNGEGPYVALYEMECADLEGAVDGLMAAFADGKLPISDALQMEPLPIFRLLKVTSER